MNYRLLIVEDSSDTAIELKEFFEDHSFDVDVANDGASFRELFGAKRFDLIIMDLTLPGEDGFRLTQLVRRESDVPIIILTGRSDVVDRIVGLELGADDYMVKPLGARELVARIRAVLRRSGATPSEVSIDRLSVGPLEIDLRTHRVHLDGEPLSLTPKEFELLAYLAADAGAVRTRTDIVEHVWDANWFGPTKTVDAHVAGIRRKLGDHAWIESVRGVGFRLAAPGDRTP